MKMFIESAICLSVCTIFVDMRVQVNLSLKAPAVLFVIILPSTITSIVRFFYINFGKWLKGKN